MKAQTTKIKTGVYKYIDSKGISFIIRGGSYWETKDTFWVANQCLKESQCSDNNSCCVVFATKKDIIKWIESFNKK